jgi:phenylpropionate dioxygenase-like ring-hydroxylating dioxygenase large terminal subunit
MVLTNAEPALRAAWHPVARSVEVAGTAISVRLLGERWTLRRDDDGALTAGPDPAALTERYGFVWLAPEPPRLDIIDVPEADDPAFLAGDLPRTHARVGAGLMMDNFLDSSHLPFVHAGTIGTPELGTFEGLAVERRGGDVVGTLEHVFQNHLDPGVTDGVRPLRQRRRIELTYRPPFTARLRIDLLDVDGANTILFLVQPEDASSCRIHARVLRNDLDGDWERLATAVKFEQGVVDEDLRLQEQYQDLTLPLDLTAEVHVRSDRMTVELRRVLRAFVVGEEEAA